MQVADRIRTLPNYPFVKIAADVRALEQQGRHIYKMTVGSPDLPPPTHVIEKLADSAANPRKHGYSGYTGLPIFRQAVAHYYKRLFGVELDPESEILPLIGSKEGLANFTLAVVNPGDRVLVPSPGYPTYAMATALAGGEAVEFSLTAEHRYLPPLIDLPTNARLMWVNYPNNPTGALANREDYQQMVDFCREHDIILASDNPYLQVLFGDESPTSLMQIDGAKNVGVEFMSLSKSHNMAGWRLGACVGSKDSIAALLRVKSNMDSGHFAPIYEAGAAALNDTPQSWINERNACYARRAKLLMEVLDDIGLSVDIAPQGAIYLWAKVAGGNDSEYVQRALHEAGVSMVPGSIYGDSGRGYVRMSLTLGEEELLKAIQQLKAWYPNDR